MDPAKQTCAAHEQCHSIGSSVAQLPPVTIPKPVNDGDPQSVSNASCNSTTAGLHLSTSRVNSSKYAPKPRT